jgi:hypothetical protein
MTASVTLLDAAVGPTPPMPISVYGDHKHQCGMEVRVSFCAESR